NKCPGPAIPHADEKSFSRLFGRHDIVGIGQKPECRLLSNSFFVTWKCEHHRPQVPRRLPRQPEPQPYPERPGEEPEGAGDPAPHAAPTEASRVRFRYLHAHPHHVAAAHTIAIPSAGHLGSRGGRGQDWRVVSLPLTSVTTESVWTWKSSTLWSTP